MKPNIIVVILSCIFLISFNVQAQSILYNQYKNLEGQYISFENFKGDRYTVLDFWATWCKPCLKSIPEIIKLNEQFKDRGISFVGVDVDSPRNLAKVRPFAVSKGIDYTVILDTEQDLMTSLNVSVLPTFIILDREGMVVYSHEGFVNGEEKVLKEKLEELVAEDE